MPGIRYRALRAIVDTAAAFDAECRHRPEDLADRAKWTDEPGPELKAIRDRLRKQRSRLRSTLESYLRGRETSRYLQEQIVTDRSGRYVLVVRSSTAARSASSMAVPPAAASSISSRSATVEINNEVVALEQQEQEEIRRILLAFSDAFRPAGRGAACALEAATELDVLQAKARLAQQWDRAGASRGWPARARGARRC